MFRGCWVDVVSGAHGDLDEAFAELPPILTAAQVAELLQMTPPGIYKWLKEGHLQGYQVGRTWFITRTSLRATLEAGSNSKPTTDQRQREG